MANEISLNWMMTVTNPTTGTGVGSTKTPPQQSITQAAQGRHAQVITVATTAAGVALATGSISTTGVCWFKNLDSTNYVEIGVQVAGTFYPVIRLNAGESYPVRLSQGVTFYRRANTASVLLEYEINEN